MSIKVRVTKRLCCDWPDCLREFSSGSGVPVATVRKEGHAAGWCRFQRDTRQGWDDVCPDHARAYRKQRREDARDRAAANTTAEPDMAEHLEGIDGLREYARRLAVAGAPTP